MQRSCSNRGISLLPSLLNSLGTLKAKLRLCRIVQIEKRSDSQCTHKIPDLRIFASLCPTCSTFLARKSRFSCSKPWGLSTSYGWPIGQVHKEARNAGISTQRSDFSLLWLRYEAKSIVGPSTSLPFSYEYIPVIFKSLQTYSYITDCLNLFGIYCLLTKYRSFWSKQFFNLQISLPFDCYHCFHYFLWGFLLDRVDRYRFDLPYLLLYKLIVNYSLFNCQYFSYQNAVPTSRALPVPACFIIFIIYVMWILDPNIPYPSTLLFYLAYRPYHNPFTHPPNILHQNSKLHSYQQIVIQACKFMGNIAYMANQQILWIS